MNRQLVQEWLPPVVYKSLLMFASEMKFLAYPHKDILQKNQQLKGVGKGKRAFLLATGPSIKQENLKLLAGEDCLSISNFYLHDDIQSVNPVFHGFAPYHEPMILENYVEWLRQADRALPPRTKIVLGHKTYELVKRFGLFPGRDVYYLYLSHKLGLDITKPVLGPQTGPLLLLPLMIYMGYEQIYLLGCDHTMLRDFKKTISNFYDKNRDIRINGPQNWEGIIGSLEAMKNVFEQYRFYKNIISLNGRSCRVTNLSRDSWLDEFPVETLDNILSSHNERH